MHKSINPEPEVPRGTGCAVWAVLAAAGALSLLVVLVIIIGLLALLNWLAGFLPWA